MNTKLILALLIACFYTTQICATSYTWNGSSGSWNDPSQWTPNGVPGAGDDVLINAGAITLPGNVAISNLVLGGGVIDGTGIFTITGNFIFMGGIMSNDGDVTVGGNFNWSGGQMGNGTAMGNVSVAGATILSSVSEKTLLKKMLTINGGGLWTGTDGFFVIEYDGILSIPAGQTFTVTAENVVVGGRNGGGTVELAGTLIKNSSSSLPITYWNSYFNLYSLVLFNNNGVMNINSGALELGGGGAHTGVFNLAGGTLRFIRVHNLNGAYLNGTGTIELPYTGSPPWTVVNLNAGSSLALNLNLFINGGSTFNDNIGATWGNIELAGGGYVANDTVVVTGNAIINGSYSGSSFLQVMGNLSIEGFLDNSGNALVGGNLNWFNGYIGYSNGGIVDVLGSTTISGNYVQGLTLAKKTLILHGGGVWSSGYLFITHNGILRIPTGSTFSVTAENPFVGGGENNPGGTIEVLGELIKNSNSSLPIPIMSGYYGYSPVVYVNNGTTSIQNGVLDLNSIASNSGVIKGNGTLDIAGSPFANTGHVVPGLSPGKLFWNGNFINSTLDIEIEPNGNTGRLDSLVVTGDAVLSGSTLNVTETTCLPNGTYPFLFWTGQRTGGFGTLNLPPGYSVQFDDVAKEARLVYVDPSPIITCPGNVSVFNDPGLCAAVGVALGNPAASDNCPGVMTSNNALSSFPVGMTNVTWTATDSKSQTATCLQSVTVTDHELPVPSCPGNIVTFNLPGACTAPVTFAATATDNCGVQSIGYSNAPGSQFPLGVTAVTVTVTDTHSNQQSCVFSVTVNPLSEICNGLDDDCNGSPEALENTWTGLGDGMNWSDPANWSDGIVPLPCQHVIIPSGSSVNVLPGFNAMGRTLSVAMGASLNVSPDATMSIEN